MPYEFKCRHCGGDFTNKNKTARYCSQACCKAASRAGLKTKCAMCGNEVYVPRCKAPAKSFCSRDCSLRHQKSRRPTRTCLKCGLMFKKKARPHGRYCSAKCFQESDENQARLTQMRRRQANKRLNSVEKAGYAILDDLGWKYEPQSPVGRYVVDALVPALNLVVQFDGDYWHGNPDRFPVPSLRQKKQLQVDERADQAAKNAGYRVVRIWESMIKTDPVKVKDRLLSFQIQEN